MAKSTFNVRTRRIPGRRRPNALPKFKNARRSEPESQPLTRQHHYVDDLACGALLIDQERRIEVANENFYKLFSLPAKAIQLGETFAAFAQRAVLNHYDGILDLGTIIGSAGDLSGQVQTITAHGLTLTARSAGMPDKKTLISIARKDAPSMSEKDRWMLGMVDSMGGAVLRLSLKPDSSLSCIYASTTAPEIFGFPQNTDLTLTENFLELFADIHRNDLTKAIMSSCETGQPIDLNLQIIHKSHGLVWTRCIGKATCEADSSITCDLRAMDIEDRMAGANERRSLEHLLDLVVDSIPFIVIVRDASTSKIVFVNRACEELSGEKREQLIGKKAARFRSGERNIWRQAARDKLVATGEPVFNPEQVLLSPTKGERTVQTSDYPLKDEKGTLRYILSITEDVTDKNAAQQALNRSEQRFDEAMAAFTDGLALFDSDDRLVLCNERYDNMWPRGEIDLVPGVAYAELVEAYAREAVAHGEQIELEQYVRDRVKSHLNPPSTREVHLFNGQWLQVTDRRTAEGGIVVTCTDITSLKEKQNDLKNIGEEALRAKENAEMANKSKSDFLANMSHELRTPLNAVIGFSEIIRDALMGREYIDEYQEYASDIHRSGSHLLALINDILDMSKIEAGELELIEDTVSLEEAIDISIKLVAERAAQNRVKLVKDLTADPVILLADTRKIRQIIINLLSNAVKFSDPGGTVTIKVEHALAGDVVLAVTDTGIGIASEEIEYVLEPFKQAQSGLDRKFEGTGLGLSLTKALTELHGGSIALRSETAGPDKGTTVTVTLPASRLLN